MKRVLWNAVLVAGGVLLACALTGCDGQTVHSPLAVNADPNASPTKVANGSGKTSKAGLVEHAVGIRFDDAQLGHAAVTNTGEPKAFTLFLWDARDGAGAANGARHRRDG